MATFKREESKVFFVCTIFFGLVGAAWGFSQIASPSGDKFLGLTTFVGFSLMCSREVLRRRKFLKSK